VTRLSTAVVICAYTFDRWTDLCESVASAASQDPAPDELLVVTDHNDLLQQRVRDELLGAHPGLRVVPNRRKQGLSGARNTALEEVTSDLERRALVANDGRRYALTAAGESTRAKLTERVDVTRRRLVDGIAAAESRATVDVLRRMAANLEAAPAGQVGS
jgi:hypothetical protein